MRGKRVRRKHNPPPFSTGGACFNGLLSKEICESDNQTSHTYTGQWETGFADVTGMKGQYNCSSGDTNNPYYIAQHTTSDTREGYCQLYRRPPKDPYDKTPYRTGGVFTMNTTTTPADNLSFACDNRKTIKDTTNNPPIYFNESKGNATKEYIVSNLCAQYFDVINYSSCHDEIVITDNFNQDRKYKLIAPPGLGRPTEGPYTCDGENYTCSYLSEEDKDFVVTTGPNKDITKFFNACPSWTPSQFECSYEPNDSTIIKCTASSLSPGRSEEGEITIKTQP